MVSDEGTEFVGLSSVLRGTEPWKTSRERRFDLGFYEDACICTNTWIVEEFLDDHRGLVVGSRRTSVAKGDGTVSTRTNESFSQEIRTFSIESRSCVGTFGRMHPSDSILRPRSIRSIHHTCISDSICSVDSNPLPLAW